LTQRQYVAGRRLKIGHGFREVGEPVPEAAGWKHLASYLSSGSVKIVEVPDKLEGLHDSLSNSTMKELKQIAAELDIKVSNMRKAELIATILKAEIAKGVVDEEK